MEVFKMFIALQSARCGPSEHEKHFLRNTALVLHSLRRLTSRSFIQDEVF